MFEISKDLVLIGAQAQDAWSVIDLLADALEKCGAVSPAYAQATREREAKHPTGLPTKPVCVALPHADATHVNRSALAVASLARPVVFRNMAEPEEGLRVELVFMLANANPDEQIAVLRNLALLLSQPEKLAMLRELSSPDDMVDVLRQELGSQSKG